MSLSSSTSPTSSLLLLLLLQLSFASNPNATPTNSFEFPAEIWKIFSLESFLPTNWSRLIESNDIKFVCGSVDDDDDDEKVDDF